MGTLVDLLSEKQRAILSAVETHASTLLDHTPRFQYFTLHGSQHISNVFRNAGLLLDAGLTLNQDQAFLLGCAICLHDLGMVVPLQDAASTDVFRGQPQPADPANLEHHIRSIHHELVDAYVERHFDFLLSLGLSPSDCAILRDISRCHRKVDLDNEQGYPRAIGALLRVVDEFDISPSRAPAMLLLRQYQDMDATSCWHWFKHNICEDWRIGHNIVRESDSPPCLKFVLAVHPPRASSVPYWLTQVRRPIARVLYDEGCTRIVSQMWGLQIALSSLQELSTPLHLGAPWSEIEEKALSAGRKVILVVDDEVRKMEDLLLPLMMTYHVIFSSNAKDALDKLAAATIDLAIVDLQIGSGFQWSAEETQDFKMTGIRLCEDISRRFSGTKIGILTGSRYDLSRAKEVDGIQFLLKKPIDPDHFEREVNRVLA